MDVKGPGVAVTVLNDSVLGWHPSRETNIRINKAILEKSFMWPLIHAIVKQIERFGENQVLSNSSLLGLILKELLSILPKDKLLAGGYE